MSSAKSWFVQTGFGATLGPMPHDALLEMIRTGALLRMDQVRAGSDGEWRPAAEFPGLFDVVTAPPTSTEPSGPDKVVAPRPALPPASPPISSKINLIPPTRPLSPKPQSVPATGPLTFSGVPPEVAVEPVTAAREITPVVAPQLEDDFVSATAPPEDDLIANWKSQRIQSQTELGLVSLAAEMTQAEETEDFAPELSANLLDDTEQAAASTKTHERPTNTRSASRPTNQRQAFLDQIPGLENGPRERAETSKQKWDRWRRSMPTWPVAAVFVVALMAVWFYWPRSNRGFYDRYVAIWEEWKTRRGDFKDKEGWEQFLAHTKSELDDMVPWLEKRARSTDREKLWLLWIGRDCFRRMLVQPRQIGSPEEKQLQHHLENLRQLYESNGSESPDAGVSASQKADPEQPTGIGAFDPNLLRPTTKTAAPVVPTTPTNSEVTPGVVPDKIKGGLEP